MNNGAYAAYAKLEVANRVTVKPWPGTFNPNSPLDIYTASKTNSIDVGAKFDFNPEDATIFSLSAEWSKFKAGAKGSPWERQNQLVLGLNALVNRYTRLFVEYFNTAGFVPLNFLSGGNLAPGKTWSEYGASSNGIVVGAQINL